MATHAVPGTGLELILNAAEGVLQIVVTEDEAILCAQEWYRSERATEILAPALAELATSLGIRWSDLRRIACVRGPGSFTGIRLTLATAAALRRCGRAQLAGLDYMQALATMAVMRRGMLYGGHVWVLTHARRNLVHCQPFISYGPEIPAQPLQGVTLCTPAEAVAAITADTADATLVCGTGLRRNADACAPLENLPAVTCLPACIHASTEALCLLARHGDYAPEDIEPLYVRPCDAVDNLPDLARRQGRDSDAATAELERLLHLAPGSEI